MLLRRTGLLALGLATGLAILAACNSTPSAETEDVASAAPPIEEDAEQFAYDSKVKVGKLISETRCSACHAIGPTGNSPHQDAKPFRQLSENYPVRNLEEALAEGIVVGHPDMPMFVLSPYEIDALIIYLESIQEPHPA
ncbi:c-type cytochrome [uncultured Hyphomonas sp.]|uniref:c-type cytochrome n=1 Tax=uncultured Hyphomonas sp. TaxID=225298 RepID=UPI002AAADB8D|nr:c-type cytochrome [uncultured Hyphomonas sp.]